MIFQFIYFLLAVFVAFYIPGSLSIRPLKLGKFPTSVLSFLVGMAAWGWVGFIFGYLQMRWFIYPYLIFTTLYWLYKSNSSFNIKNIKLSFGMQEIILAAMLLVGVFIQVSAIWFTGVSVPKGMFFCCGNLSDNIYHLALTNELVSRFPPFEPGAFGIIVHNYHYWSNQIIADLVRVFHLPLISTQFQYMAIFVSLFLGLSALAFSYILKLPKAFRFWIIFFLYFGSDLIYLLVSLIRREVNFEMSSLEDGATFLVNPPRAFSIILLFAGFSLFVIWMRKKNVYLGLLTAFVFAALIGIKVYTGLFAIFGVLFLIPYFLYKKEPKALVLPLLIIGLGVIVYLPVNSGAGGFYYTGLSIFENFIVQPWMTLDRWELARQIYVAHHSIFRIIQYELMYILVYIVTIFGFKTLAIFQSRKSLSFFPKEFNIFAGGGGRDKFDIGIFLSTKVWWFKHL